MLEDTVDSSIHSKKILARALCNDPAASRADIVEAVALMADALKITQRVYGQDHSFSIKAAKELADLREALARH